MPFSKPERCYFVTFNFSFAFHSMDGNIVKKQNVNESKYLKTELKSGTRPKKEGGPKQRHQRW